jgi:hypothetical protein
MNGLLKKITPVALLSVSLVLTSLPSIAQKMQNRNGKNVDFSGHWEMDYSDSDNIQATLNGMIRELQRRAERQNSGNMNRRTGPAVSMGSGGSYNTAPSVMGLAQMADLVTQSQLLVVEQEEFEISIKRDASFALSCEFYSEYFHTVETPFGNESCGWDSHQLLFRILLPEGLSIQHRFTLGPSGEKLNVATTVVSDRVSYPFTLNRVYNRFEPGDSGITCELTLTRGKVCTTESSK